MDAIELLVQDHALVKGLFTQVEQAEQEPERLQEAAKAVTVLLRAHTELEEQLFYPAIRDQGGEIEELVSEGLEEHHVADTLLSEIEGMQPGDEQYMAKLKVLQENVEHHVEEEEQELFPKVRKAMGDSLDDLGAQMKELHDRLLSERAEAASGDGGQGGLIDLTRDELYERAKEANVSGASRMTKDELVQALGGDS